MPWSNGKNGTGPSQMPKVSMKRLSRGQRKRRAKRLLNKRATRMEQALASTEPVIPFTSFKLRGFSIIEPSSLVAMGGNHHVYSDDADET